MRNASCKRVTGETDISMELNLDGTGCAAVATGHAFFDHMLDLLARHSLMDLTLQARGDLEVDAHHTVEDVGIVLGECIKNALGDKKGIVRYGCSYLPMDETLTHVEVLYGRDGHHIAESVFKGIAHALRQAAAIDPRAAGTLPSTKGML